MNIIKRINLATKVAFGVLKSTSTSNLTILNSSNTYTYTYKSKYAEAYNLCPSIQACVTKKANAITNGKLIPVDPTTEELKTVGHFSKVLKVLKRPNKYQNMEQFIKTVEVFVNVYGACYVYKIKPIGTNDITGLIVLPNDSITINKRTDFVYIDKEDEQVLSYQVSIFNRTFLITDVSEVSVIYDTTINLMKVIEPQSRIDAIWENVESVINSVNSRNAMTKNRGAEGILAPERGDATASAIGLGDKERERLQDEYKKYGSTSSQWHTLIAKVPMRFQAITRTPVALGLFDGENADSRTIAQHFGVPIPLLGLPDTTKFNTYLEAKKEFYDDTIIPEARNIAMWLSELFETEKNGYVLMFDYSYLNFLQGDEKMKADTYKTMSETVRGNIDSGLMTIEEGKLILSEYE